MAGLPTSPAPAGADPLIGTRMRVWWPPTTNKEKTGFAGAYWPVRVLNKKKTKYTVEYDNGDTEDVLTEHLAPDDPPVDFGEEKTPLQQGEFCEVSNNSKTDPCAWVARVQSRVNTTGYMVEYPFHDSKPEYIPNHLIRRARVLDMDGWCLLRPRQDWEDGEIQSPHELETIKEDDLAKFYPQLLKLIKADNIVKIENESSRVGDKRGTPEGKPQLSSRPTQRVKLE